MKCEDCQGLLEEYIDAELSPADHAQVEAHLNTCAECSASFATLTSEQELFARYDREIEVPPFLWTRVAAHTVSENVPQNGWHALLFARFSKSLAGAIAVLLIALAIGLVYLFKKPVDPALPRNGTDPNQARNQKPVDVKPGAELGSGHSTTPGAELGSGQYRNAVTSGRSGSRARPGQNRSTGESDVLSSDLAFDIDDQDTARHIEQTQILLRSIRNVQISDSDDEIDVSYDKALSRRLLNENVVLRREAEMKAKFPTKTLLADLEPFLIDIANLPDRARPEDVRVIKERVQKTEIVAALLDYQDRGTNNR